MDIKISLPDHMKAKKLMRQLGDRAFYSLIRLWEWAARHKPNGIFIGMDKDDIEIVADWQGVEGLFIDTLIDLRLIDCNNGVCAIRNWVKNDSYAALTGAGSAKTESISGPEEDMEEVKEMVHAANAIDDNRYLNEKQVSVIVGRSTGTLRCDRSKRVGIPYHKVGRSIRYLWADVRAFMEETKIETDDFY